MPIFCVILIATLSMAIASCDLLEIETPVEPPAIEESTADEQAEYEASLERFGKTIRDADPTGNLVVNISPNIPGTVDVTVSDSLLTLNDDLKRKALTDIEEIWKAEYQLGAVLFYDGAGNRIRNP